MRCTVPLPAIATVGTLGTAKILGWIKPAANVPIEVAFASVSLQGNVTTEKPLLCELLYVTSDGTSGGDGATITPVKWDDRLGETPQTAAYGARTDAAQWTTPPTVDTPPKVLRRIFVHPQSRDPWFFPFDGRLSIGGGKRLAIRVTTAENVSHIVCAEFVFDE